MASPLEKTLYQVFGDTIAWGSNDSATLRFDNNGFGAAVGTYTKTDTLGTFFNGLARRFSLVTYDETTNSFLVWTMDRSSTLSDDDIANMRIYSEGGAGLYFPELFARALDRNVMILESSLRDVAKAIREKNGTENKYTISQMSDAILAIPAGGGAGLLILVTAPTGSTVTAARGGNTYTAAESATAPGTWEISVPEYGIYTVTAALDGAQSSAAVSLTEETVTLAYISAAITVISDPGAALTVAGPGGTQTAVSTGSDSFTVTSEGTYTVTAEYEGDTMSATVEITEDGQSERVSLRFWTKRYTELEYIESTGSQYISTGFAPNQSTRVVEKVYAQPNVSLSFFGAREGAYSKSFMFFATAGSCNLTADYGSSRNTSNMKAAAGTTLVVDFNGNTCTITRSDGVTETVNASAQSFTTPCTMMLFQASTNGSVGSNGTAVERIYECRIYDAGTLVRDFVPCRRNSDEAVGLYDRENDTFYPDARGGNFVAGPEV